MQKLSIAFLLGCLSFIISPQLLHAQKGTLVVKVMDFESGDGNLEMTLYNQEKGFPEELEYSVDTKVQKLNGKTTAVMRWENLPYGDYALAGMHDENGNGEMDYNWIGMPTEGYCFSNDVKPVLSAPSYKSVSFQLEKPVVTVYIHMQN